MSGPSKSEASDTSFRKTWDRAEYAAKATVRASAEKQEARARHEAKQAGHKYHGARTPAADATVTETVSRSTRLDVSANVGKTSLVPAGAALGKRGRGAGFYCADCDLTFKDNRQLVDHLNSRQHLLATGQSGDVKRASLSDVQARLAWLARRRADDRDAARSPIDLAQRLQRRVAEDERERAEKRARRNERRRKTDGGLGIKTEDEIAGGIIC